MNHSDNTIISVCLCTFKRAVKLEQCLQSLLIQSIDQSFEVIVIDNDIKRSGEHVVKQHKEAFQQVCVPTTYMVEPIQNIALARNRSLQAASGKYVAFIDDDERASPSWLNNLFLAMTETEADGVWGPVIPDIPESFPKWMHRSNLFQRENPKDRSVMKGHSLRTSNALIKRELLCLRDGPFDEHLGKTGGSDSDLFNWIRMKEENAKFVWAKNAEVIEDLEEKRRYIKWHLRRAYRGGWGFSRGLALRYGVGKGFIISVTRIIPSFLKAIGAAVRNYNNVRYAGLIILINIAVALGKCGYFLGKKIEEYQG